MVKWKRQRFSVRIVASRSLALALGLTSTWSGCAAEVEPRTQLMLVADTDVPAPNKIVFRIEGDGRNVPHEASYASAGELPRTLAVVHSEGPLGPLTVSASIETADGVTITRTHEVSFVPGKTLSVPLHLARACATQTCPALLVCDEGGQCTQGALDSDTLVPYTTDPPRVWGPDGGAPHVDAGAQSDAGTTPSYRDCNGEAVDVHSDPSHCGSCENVCETGRRSTGAECVLGACVLLCEANYRDCDGRVNNGCEVNIRNDVDHCGGCDMACTGRMNCRDSACE